MLEKPPTPGKQINKHDTTSKQYARLNYMKLYTKVNP